jgi:hypothetical protein
MILNDIAENKLNIKKESVRLALLEQQNHYISSSLEKIEIVLGGVSSTIDKNNEKINHKLEKLERKIDNRIKWLLNTLIMIFFSSAGLLLTVYEIWKKI